MGMLIVPLGMMMLPALVAYLIMKKQREQIV
jgi:hypothetical protein